VVFRLAGRQYAVGVGDVVEVLRMVAVQPLPQAPGWVLGVLNYRGRVIRVLDGRARLGLPRVEPGVSTSIAVVQAGGRIVGVVVDEAVGFAVLPEEVVQRGGEVAGEGSVVCAVARRGDELVLVLDCARLCADLGDADLAGVDIAGVGSVGGGGWAP
jgi:purine-binding chemotaxis protein CheW